ncbi:phage Gp19/Gp15/Gp42 family protein [Microbacterium sp. MPKO10]|uniref:phage Gp19/Gp15/Gp42 family protein n=1 Tax=Microbacterium sp. MPKO10 TaxID=2989818 RepID=UPI0022358F0A|nr:phage Gp19/Gp15/Gp42 family protein [Microbacterium sp. MPKO10]MCW4458184.1 phage Gp19/Gp15/Gp42 family protein [Microbacterium sp. MPKO10]
MSWTEPDDVVDSWIGANVPDDDDLIQKWIDRAEREIRFRVPDLQARIDAEAELEPPVTDLLETAKDVVVAMVTRVFRNPEGIRQTNTTTGPFTESRTYGGDVPGGLGVTDDELAKLQGARGGAFEIDLMPARVPSWGFPWRL